MATILKVGNVDLSEYCSEGNYIVTRDPVYDSGSEFVNTYGETKRDLIGFSVGISLSFEGMAEETAKALDAATRSDSISVVYTTPLVNTSVFRSPSLKMASEDMDGGKMIYSGSLSLSCELVPLDGL